MLICSSLAYSSQFVFFLCLKVNPICQNFYSFRRCSNIKRIILSALPYTAMSFCTCTFLCLLKHPCHCWCDKLQHVNICYLCFLETTVTNQEIFRFSYYQPFHSVAYKKNFVITGFIPDEIFIK